MADRRSVFKGVGSRRREDGLRTKEHDVVGKRKGDVDAGDQRLNSRRGDVDQYALISDLRNQGFVEDGAALCGDKCTERESRLLAPLRGAAVPQLDFRPDRAVRVTARFLRPVRDRLIGNAVLRPPWPDSTQLGEQVLERREAHVELLPGNPTVPQADEFVERRDVGHGKVEVSVDELVFAALAFPSLAGVFLCEEFVWRAFGSALDHQFEAGDTRGGSRKVGNRAGDLKDDDAVGCKRRGVGAQLKHALRPAVEHGFQAP